MQNMCVDGEGVKWQREVIGGEVDPGVPLTNSNDSRGGGFDRSSYFKPKNHNFRMCLLKKVTTFLANPKNSLILFSQPKKNTSVFHRSKRITFGQNFKPKKITRTSSSSPPPPPPSLKYVSGAPGDVGNRTNFDVLFHTVII